MTADVYRKSLLFLLLSLAASVAAAQPYLVRDIRTTGETMRRSSRPEAFTAMGSQVLFRAESPTGIDLWKTDGTAAGTSLVIDLPHMPADIASLGSFGYFTASDGVHGKEIWKTDGTPGGTALLKDIHPGSWGGVDHDDVHFTVVGTRLYFLAADETHGRELWVTDGTEGGTQMVADLAPGWADFPIHHLIAYAGKLYFLSADALWSSDGTAAGTAIVASGFTPIGAPQIANGLLYFRAGQSATGRELWVSDGTAGGTRLVADLTPGAGSTFTAAYGQPAMAAVAGGILFPTGTTEAGEIRFTDGTAAGTRIVTTYRDLYGTGYPVPSLLTSGSRALFISADTDNDGLALWSTDGTAAGTQLLHAFPYAIRLIPNEGGRAFFTNADQELWVTDGTPAGTQLVKTTGLTSDGSSFHAALIGNQLYFSAGDDQHGNELWTSDGTPDGTYIVANIHPDTAPSSHPAPRLVRGTTLYFDATPDGSSSPTRWQTDGTSGGTTPVPQFLRGSTPIASLGGFVYYTRFGGEIWRSDGTTEGTLVRAFPSNDNSGYAYIPFAAARKLFIVARNDGFTMSLWASDGTTAGTVLLLGELDPSLLALLGEGHGLAYLGGGPQRRELWVSDGTAAGTRRLRSFPAPILGAIHGGGFLYFLISPGAGQLELWRSDGTGNGTVLVKTLTNREASPSPNEPVLGYAGGLVYFGVKNLATGAGHELWRSNGTAAGTYSILGPIPQITGIVALGDRAIVQARDLWITSGDFSSIQLKAFVARPPDTPANLVEIDGTVYFSAYDSLGRELWSTDGTPAGTQPVVDLAAGTASSTPLGLVRVGNRLFFSAETSLYGRELWALDLPAPTPRLAIGDARVSEAATTAQLSVTLSAASNSTVSLNWQSENLSATAGADYTAGSGTLVFEPGETSKTIAIALTPDTAFEGPEQLRVSLSNPSGAPMANTIGTIAIIDDDATADLEITEAYSAHPLRRTYTIRNHGPAPATQVLVRAKMSPVATPGTCAGCLLGEIAAGATATLHVYYTDPFPSSTDNAYALSASVSSNERDPNEANNSVVSITDPTAFQHLTMPTTHPLPGTTTTATIGNASNSAVTFTPASSDARYVTVPASITVQPESVATFPVQAVAAGVAVITATSSNVSLRLAIDVLGPYQTIHWPTAVVLQSSKTNYAADEPVPLTARVYGEPPFRSDKPTGSVQFLQNGTYLGDAPVVNGVAQFTAPRAMGGSHPFTALYLGDVQFAPSRGTVTVSGAKSFVKFTSWSRALDPDRVLVTIRFHGSHGISPTGTVTFNRNQQPFGSPATVQPSDVPGESLVSVIVSGTASLQLATSWVSIEYSGDGYYYAGPGTFPMAPSLPDDFEGGASSDLLWRNASTGVYYMTMIADEKVQGGFFLSQVADTNWELVARADFDGDRDSDILWRNRVTGAGWMYVIGNGIEIEKSAAVALEPNLDWQIAAVGDFDGDGRADLYWRHRHTGANWTYRMKGEQILASLPVAAVPDTQWRVVGAGDFNADGRADVFWRHATGGHTYVHLMHRNEVTAAAYVATVADANWNVEGIRDFDGDGRSDILWRNTATGSNWMYRMNGLTIAESGAVEARAPEWRIAAVGSYDYQDARTDILWRHSTTGEGWLYTMNGLHVVASHAIGIERGLQWQIVK